MSQRGVFCLNATTMGLSASQPSSPRDPPPELDRQPDKKDQKQQQAQEREEEKCEEQAKQQNEKPNEPLDESKKQPKEEGPKDQAQPIPAATAPQPRSAPQAPHAHPTVKDLPHICRHYAAFSLSGGCESSVGCGSVQSKSGLTLTATEHYHNQLEKLRSICGDAAVTNFELNNLFLDRLKEIDCLDEECGGDSKFATLRLATFQDWVDLLLHVNYIIFGNMTAMEVEAYEKIMNCFRSVRGEQQQAQDENRKLRKDMCAIIKLVQHAFHHNTWNTDDMCLETLTVNQLLGIQADQARPESESEKVTKDMRSLTNEMAAKHDEVRHLQSQMCALDEVVQTARQKLILKDQCIAQLNQQLVELQDCLANMSQELNNKTRTVKQYEEAFDTMDRNSCLFENINEMDQQANELMRLLNKELNEIINIISTKDFQAMEYRRKLLSCFIDRINNDRMETMRKLENMRSQLRALDCSIDQLELPLACSTQRPEDKYDNQLIDALRRRLIAINQCNKELNCRCQQVEAQQRFELLNVTSDFEAVRAINEKNCQVLKEIAELLSKLRCCDLSYEEIYTEKSSGNPFCIAIMEMYEKLNQLENNTETENLQSLNERLVCQIESLRVVLQERESKICELQTGYVDLNETNRLREEIFLLKQENCEQSQKVVQITSLLQAKEYERQEANANNEAAMQMYEDQCKELRRAHNEVKRLKECLSSLENCQQELNEERNSLRAEITALKNREAELCGKDRALNEQLKCKEQDLEKSRCLLHDMQCHLKQEERQHKETLDRLCQANDDIRKQMRDVANECKQMQLKLKQQTKVNEQQQQIIESFRKWKDAQIRSDEAMRQCMKRAEEHINLLLEENQRLCEEYRRLYSDYSQLESEMQRVKNAVNKRFNTSSCPTPASPQPDSVICRSQAVSDEMANRLKFMSCTAQRLSAQCQALKSNSLDLSIIKSMQSSQNLSTESSQCCQLNGTESASSTL